MRGLDPHQTLVTLGATYQEEVFTAPLYRLWSIDDRHPAMQRVPTGGAGLAVEVWDLPEAAVAAVLQQEPLGLCLGKVVLADGEVVLGVLGEAFLCAGKLDITEYRGWRNYLAEAALGS